MTTAGIDATALDKLEALQQKAKKNLKFMRLDPDEDLILHVNTMRYATKGATNIVFRSQDGTRIYNYPCITKIFEPEKGPFTKERARDPVTCTRIQHALCKLCPDPAQIEEIQQHVRTCACRCDDCYRLAFREHYLWGTLPFKN